MAFDIALKILYILAGLLCLSFLVEMVVYLANRTLIKNWKPDVNKMHYIIKTNVETCVPQFSYNEDADVYEVEYRELLTGKLIIKQILRHEQYLEQANKKTVSIETSTLRIYTVTPNKHVLHRDFTRTAQDEQYRPYSKYDITYNLLRICAEYFKRNCPNKGAKKGYKNDIKFVEGLPSVKDIRKQRKV